MLLILATAALLGAQAAEGPKLSGPPKVSASGDGVRIEFTIDREADVAVFVVDAKGKAVRHLAAGAVGKNAPEPLRSGLSQSIVWDRKDDFGKPAAGGPFKVRVAVGLKPEFDRFLLHNPDGC